jgi:hypothetical protein
MPSAQLTSRRDARRRFLLLLCSVTTKDMARPPTSASISLQPAFEANIAYQTAGGSEKNPQFEVKRTDIYDLNDVKNAFWAGRKPWEVFDTERVIDVKRDLPPELRKNVSSDDWLKSHAPHHIWFWKMPADSTLGNFNGQLAEYCKQYVGR